MSAYQITLKGEAIEAALAGIAYEFAFKSINRVATVEEAPAFSKADEKRWRDLRDTLESLNLGDDLPAIEHPEWPVRFSYSDDVVTKWEPLKIGDAIIGRRVLETKKKKGAKRRPLYSKDVASKAARAWRVAFFAAIGIDFKER